MPFTLALLLGHALVRWFSDFNVYQSCLEAWLEHRPPCPASRVSGSEAGLRIGVCSKFSCQRSPHLAGSWYSRCLGTFSLCLSVSDAVGFSGNPISRSEDVPNSSVY